MLSLSFESEKDKEMEIFLARLETEGVMALANGILKLARVYNINRENLRELGIYVFRETSYPVEFLKLLKEFNPSAYKTPIDMETALQIIEDFFTCIKRPRIVEDQAEWLRKNLP
ncbi:hypothetical protein [Desulfurobacterium crinifex]